MSTNSEERILKITNNGWIANSPEKGRGFSIFKKRPSPKKLILTNNRLILGEDLFNYRLNILLEDIDKVEIEFEFMMPPKLKLIHKSDTTYFHFGKKDFGFALLSMEEQDLRTQSYLQSWIEAINRTKDKEITIKVRCPNCKTLNPENAKFCLECGTPLG